VTDVATGKRKRTTNTMTKNREYILSKYTLVYGTDGSPIAKVKNQKEYNDARKVFEKEPRFSILSI